MRAMLPCHAAVDAMMMMLRCCAELRFRRHDAASLMRDDRQEYNYDNIYHYNASYAASDDYARRMPRLRAASAPAMPMLL